ncbi:GNAT family N-acetyltransferase [Myceligenerans xiligouense]|uniref:Acetyltransferase (GNAT) family protein n=1 Tax=Myceligenerans xiligouense TaxID=253184 RepID=A0A3N4YNG6_9MICO|nr:GNAT family N-acetyltransferase [Myceligenerans xiligouense]RPF21006.1 acetyltransferase (GNAT) family protein [Myceligenerans xiligouense]
MVAEESPYEFSADPGRIDPARVYALLAEHAYWVADRSREVQDAAIAGSRNYAVYARESGTLVGYARVVTDGATFAWLADVVVDPAHRRRGLARLLVEGITGDLDRLGVARTLLRASSEGRALYEDLGWKPVDEPDAWMARYRI